MKKSDNIRPGKNVNIVLDVDVYKEITDVRSATIFDTKDTEIILSQTSPPVARYNIGKEIIVTCIVRGKEKPHRIGFPCKILDIVEDYSLESAEHVQAIRVARQTGVKTYDVRMHYRVKPRLGSGIYLEVAYERVTLIDISLGGARFCHSRDNSIEPQSIIKIILSIDGLRFGLEAKTENVWYPSERRRRSNLEYVSIQFLKMDRTCSHSLSGKILAIEREFLAGA